MISSSERKQIRPEQSRKEHTKAHGINVEGFQSLDVLVNNGPTRHELVYVQMPREALLHHVSTMEESGAALGIDEVLGVWVDSHDLGQVSLDDLKDSEDDSANGCRDGERFHLWAV